MTRRLPRPCAKARSLQRGAHRGESRLLEVPGEIISNLSTEPPACRPWPCRPPRARRSDDPILHQILHLIYTYQRLVRQPVRRQTPRADCASPAPQAPRPPAVPVRWGGSLAAAVAPLDVAGVALLVLHPGEVQQQQLRGDEGGSVWICKPGANRVQIRR